MSGLKKYLLFTFIVTWVIEIIASQNDLSTAAGRVSMSHAMSISMLIPAFGALFARANIKDMGWLPDFGLIFVSYSFFINDTTFFGFCKQEIS